MIEITNLLDFVNYVIVFPQAPGCSKDPRKRTNNRESITPLHQAVYNKHPDTVKVVFIRNVLINTRIPCKMNVTSTESVSEIAPLGTE